MTKKLLEKMERKFFKPNDRTFERLEKCNDFTQENIEEIFKSYITEKELGMGAVLPCMRLVLTGKGMALCFCYCCFIRERRSNKKTQRKK